MVIVGSWRISEDGVYRPVVTVHLTDASGGLVEARMVVDTGADGTVLTAGVLAATGLTPLPSGDRLEGAGGVTRGVSLNTVMLFTKSDGGRVRMNGPFLAFTDPTALDLNVLGRDVLNNFDVIVSRRRNVVALLADPHAFAIIPPV